MYYRIVFITLLTIATTGIAAEPLLVWPDFAPEESTKLKGTLQPYRPGEVPPVDRVTDITQPTFTVHLAKQPNGKGLVILPGGGFGKVVPNKEGTEAAAWLNRHGISAFVLSYRTKSGADDPGWNRPLQDAQRTLSIVRSRAEEWRLKKDQIGLLGFSAGGQVAARLLSSSNERSYEKIDLVDSTPYYPNYALLIYPWSIYDTRTRQLIDGVSVPKSCPPTFLVHTDDDRSSSLGAVLFYTQLKHHKIPSELHVYGNGGHGYGLRPVKGSEISSWPSHATHWLNRLKD